MSHTSPQTNLPVSLPCVPWELIRLAVADLKACKADPDYEIDMMMWHQPTSQYKCWVCLAGAVMAQTLEVPKFKVSWPETFEGRNCYLLRSLDQLRKGNLRGFLLEMVDAGWRPAVELNEYEEFEKLYFDDYFEKDCQYLLDLADRLEVEYAE